MASEQFSLCWDNFHKNMSSGMNSLLENEDLVDVTLAMEGKYLKAHKMVLSVCSPYFRELFKATPCKHPIVFMKDVSYVAMSDLLQFMYQGEVQVSQENLTTFIKTAEALQIKGLTGDGNGSAECDNDPQDEPKPEAPKMMRQKKMVHPPPPPAPAPKRPRLSQPEPPPTAPAVTKTEPASTSTSSNELIQFKMEPYDQGQSSSVTIADDNPDDTFGDDPLDDTNADDGNEDYSMMEGGDEEPQAGTSADGTAGEGQASEQHCSIRVRELSSLIDPSLFTEQVASSIQQSEVFKPEIVWEGKVEWFDQEKALRCVPFQASAFENDAPSAYVKKWPKILKLQLLPKNSTISLLLLKNLPNSIKIFFEPQLCYDLALLKNDMSSHYACTYFSGEPVILILCYGVENRSFLAVIPNDKADFLQKLHQEDCFVDFNNTIL